MKKPCPNDTCAHSLHPAKYCLFMYKLCISKETNIKLESSKVSRLNGEERFIFANTCIIIQDPFVLLLISLYKFLPSEDSFFLSVKCSFRHMNIYDCAIGWVPFAVRTYFFLLKSCPSAPKNCTSAHAVGCRCMANKRYPICLDEFRRMHTR